MILSEELTPRDIEIVLHRLGIEPKGRTDSNGWTTIKSPLRDEQNPSFGLNLQKGNWKDHGTDESGDLVTLAKHILNKDTKEAISWIKEQTNLAGVLYQRPRNGSSYNKSKPKKRGKFWTDEKKKLITSAQTRLKDNPEHEVIQQANDYDCLTIETLQFFGVGLIEKWGKDRLAFPYETGVQLYRREDGNKIIRSLKGSKPAQSFFGSRKVSGNKDSLFMAKSPRECMLLHQQYSHRADVIGIATGEQGRLSTQQIKSLRNDISASDYLNIYVFMDCDSDAAYTTAQSFTDELANALDQKIYLINIHESTGGTFKDITDCIQTGMDEKTFNVMLEDAEEIENANSAENATGNMLEKQLDIATAPAISDEVYNNLPELLKTRCSLVEEQHRRDVFLVSALPVIAAHMPNVLAGHVDGHYSPDLFTLIVAGPGTGKGVSSKAKALGSVLNKQLVEQSKRDIKNWETMPDEEKAGMERPKEQSLLIPANSSSRAIYDTLEANGGNGLLFENEIDTMLNATSQEWGNFSDICRKAFHHESLSINRKKERYWIENPRLSICITGTFDQFKNMFESAENGHFSRYALYTFDVPRVWQSHRPTNRSRSLDESVETASNELYEMYKRLSRRREPLYIDLTDKQWQAIDDTFAEKMQIIEDLDLSSHLHASNNRAAVLALRMASMFAVLRANNNRPETLPDIESLTPTMADINAAILLADTFIKHAIRLYYILPKSDDSDSKGERYKQFISMLPNEFETSDAYEVAETLDIPERTVRHWLSTIEGFNRLKRGYYEKR